MIQASYKLATVWGIPIKVHISLVLLYAWIISQFGPGLGLMLGVGVSVSIVLHELGHSYVALKKGCRVRGITLMFMGGVAQMEEIPSKPGDEALMAIAGPLVSLVTGALFILAGWYLPIPPTRVFYPLNALILVGMLNIALMVFNLVPIPPLDGSKIIEPFLPYEWRKAMANIEQYGMILVIFFVMFAFPIISSVISFIYKLIVG